MSGARELNICRNQQAIFEEQSEWGDFKAEGGRCVSLWRCLGLDLICTLPGSAIVCIFFARSAVNELGCNFVFWKIGIQEAAAGSSSEPTWMMTWVKTSSTSIDRRGALSTRWTSLVLSSRFHELVSV